MTAPIKSGPILFSAPMVFALLAGTKTQTRRIVKTDDLAAMVEAEPERSIDPGSFCPYGKPGDLLWVKEGHFRFGHWEPVLGVRTKGNRQKWKFVADRPEFRFDAPAEFRKGRHHKDPATPAWHKRLARFMPRAASRITLEVTCVRVELLWDISEADAKAEGVREVGAGFDVDLDPGQDESPHKTAREAFANLWDSINGERASWASNPWVWCVSFKRVTP